jgi:hypothetical protein
MIRPLLDFGPRQFAGAGPPSGLKTRRSQKRNFSRGKASALAPICAEVMLVELRAIENILLMARHSTVGL